MVCYYQGSDYNFVLLGHNANLLRLFQHFFQYVDRTIDNYVLELGVFYLLHHFPEQKFYFFTFRTGRYVIEFVTNNNAPVIWPGPQMVQKCPMSLWILNLQQSMTTDQTIRSLVQYREDLPLEIDYDLIEYLAAMRNTPTLVNEANTTFALFRVILLFEILERA